MTAEQQLAFAAFDRLQAFAYCDKPMTTSEGCRVATKFSAEGYDRATRKFFGVIEHVTLNTNDDNTPQGNP